MKKVKRDFENIDVSSAYRSVVQQSEVAPQGSDYQSTGAPIDHQLAAENHRTEPSLQNTGREYNSNQQQQIKTDDGDASPRKVNWDNIQVQSAQYSGSTLPLFVNKDQKSE